MDFHFHRDDQTSVIDITSKFVNFYYTNINSKTIINLFPYLRQFTIYSSQKSRYQNEGIIEYFKNLELMNAQFTDIDYDTLHSGARRINILVSGTITYDQNGTRISNKFSEFIHLSTKKEKDKDMEIWVQMSMMKII
tara:strand:+ start:59 stop:469 length:411 start_codon:yes stop_codon:yes gene_type:complete